MRGSGPGLLESIDALHATAVEETGLADFGDPAYRRNLELLLDCYDREANLSEAGRQATQRMLVDCLKGRLFSTHRLALHSRCLERPVDQPLVIAGLPRSASTALHKLLAADPGAQALEYWLGCQPDVRPPRRDWADHPSFRSAVAALDRLYGSSPDLRAAHSMRAGEADECRLLFMQDFLNLSFSFNANIPSYESWVLGCDMRPAYGRYRDNLKLIGSRDPDKRWVLKNSSHLWALPALEATFPDACIVQTHRDPRDWIPSIASLVHRSRRIYEPDVRKEDVGEQQLRHWSRVVERSRSDRAKLSCRVLDIHYDHFVRDPVGCVRRIYDHFGWSWSAEIESPIRRWSEVNPQHEHGVHRYTAREYGLSEERIAERFADYIEWERKIRCA